ASENSDIMARRFGADGAPAGDEFFVNTHRAGPQEGPAVTALSNGGFVVTWESYDGAATRENVYGQAYGANGAPVGSEFQVNTTLAGSQNSPTVTALDTGGFLVAWSDGGQQHGRLYH